MDDLASLHTPSTAPHLPAEWTWRRLDTVCEGIFDCPHSTPLLTEAGPYIARSQDVRTGIFRLEGAGRVSEATYAERIARAEPRHGDLLYSREGTYFGIAAEVPPGIRVCLGQRMVLLRPDASVTDTRFLRYWLNSPAMVSHIHGHRDGSVAERLNLPTIRGLPVALPSLAEQRVVGRILGTLDDKTELNRRMNVTLEAIAHAIFKSWFVDFDPVRAKMGSPDPSLPKSVTELFAAHLVNSEVGDIPHGWEVQSFSDTVDIVGGGTPKTSVAEYWNGDVPWFSVVDAPSMSDIWVIDTDKKITLEGIENSAAQILPPGTTIISARGTVGRIALVGVPMAMNQSCYGLRGKSGRQGIFNYFATRQLVSLLQQRAHGSVFDTITRDTLKGVQVAVPPEGLVDAFEACVGPLLDRIRTSLSESRTLVDLRNTLLPKLISGELRVRKVERLLEEAL